MASTSMKVHTEHDVCMMTLTSSSCMKAVQGFTMSKRFMKTVLRATVINILYHRLPISENEFVTKMFNNVAYKSFKTKSTHPLIRDFHVYMAACNHAIESNYLKDMYLYFIDNKNGDIVENYKFSVRFNTNLTQTSETGTPVKSEHLIENTTEFLKTLTDLESHDKFSDDISVKVEFTYIDGTPESYQPAGFQDINPLEAFLNKMPRSGNSVLLGKISTGFHRMNCRALGVAFNLDCSTVSDTEMLDKSLLVQCESKKNSVHDQMQDVSWQEPQPEKMQIMPPNEAEVFTEDISEPDRESDGRCISDLNSKASTRASTVVGRMRKLNDTYVSDFVCDASEDSQPAGCICDLDAKTFIPIFEGVALVQCEMCCRKYHSVCQRIKGPIPLNFRCDFCKSLSKKNSGRKSPASQVIFAKMRLIANYIGKYKKMPENWEIILGSDPTEFLKHISVNHKTNNVRVNKTYLDMLYLK